MLAKTEKRTLVRYETARRALADAYRVDEVKNIRDKALAMQAYAKQAKDTELIDHATEIRLRAERRAGELLTEMKERGERNAGGKQNLRPGSRKATPGKEPKLSDLGISKTQSSKWQKLAAMPDAEFETKVDTAKKTAVASLDRAATRTKRRSRKATRQTFLGPINACVIEVTKSIRRALAVVGDERSALFKELRHQIDQLEHPKEG